MKRLAALLLVVLASCARERPTADPDLKSEIDRVPAIDNHAHPVRYVPAGRPPDRFFDALPVDNMEPQSDPVNLRLGAPAIAAAARTLYGSTDRAAKQRAIDQRRDGYPAWVLDQAGIETLLANRVEMGPSIQPPRFRWVPYIDALLFPLSTSALAARNSDRKSFFALENILLQRYLK